MGLILRVVCDIHCCVAALLEFAGNERAGQVVFCSLTGITDRLLSLQRLAGVLGQCKEVDNFEDLIPLYYGWFLNEADSLALFEVGQVWLEKIFKIPQFQKQFLRLTGVMYLQELLNYFRKPDEGFMFHCTAQYIGKKSTPEALEYIEKCQTSVGKVFDIEIVGFVFTPRTFGARIKLSPEQLKLWGKDDNEEVPADFWYVDFEEDEESLDGADMQVTNGEGGANYNGNADEGKNSSVVTENDFISNGTSENQSPNMTNGNDFIPNGTNDHNLSDVVHETNDSIHNVSNKESKNSPEGFTLNSSSESYPDISEDVTFQLANHNDQNKQNGTSTPLINDKDTGKNPSPSKNKLPLSDNKSSPIKQNGHTAKGSTSPQNRSWVSKSKSPRKPKANVHIPENEMDIADTSTRETFVSFPNENSEGKLPLTHGLGSRAHFTLGCAPHIKPVTTGLDLILAVTKEYVTHGRTELDLNELYKQKEMELSASSKEGESALSYCTFVEGGTIMNYENGVWVIYPEEKLVAKSVFAAKF